MIDNNSAKNQHIMSSFDDDLTKLRHMQKNMTQLTIMQLMRSHDIIATPEEGAVTDIMEGDQAIDELEQDIYQKAVQMLAMRQPMAHDLRLILAATKTASDYERIADHAENICKRCLQIKDLDPFEEEIKVLQKLGKKSIAALENVSQAYFNVDLDAAYIVWQRDQEINDLYNDFFKKLTNRMCNEPSLTPDLTQISFIGKNFERIGDHAKNVAETIGFIKTGKTYFDERSFGSVK